MNDPETVMSNSSSKPSDVEIVRRVMEGEINAFESLLLRYKDHVLEVVKKHVPYNEVEETAHDVFVRAYQSLSTFKERSSFKQWLSTIAVRACYDFWRKKYRSRELPMSSLAEEHQKWLEKVVSNRSGQSFADKYSQGKARELLDWALNRLSPEDRMVLELIYLEGLSGREAADLLGWSVANVKVRSLRARRKLHNLLARLVEA
jgi:RNA polymerase sigma-70 factor (ECF subfamily)